MSNIDYGFNIEDVLGRMMVATRSRSLSKMGELLGLSINALGQSKQRGSIALTTLLKCQRLAFEMGNEVTLDYLVHGDGEIVIRDVNEKPRDERYASIRLLARLSTEPPTTVLFDKEWLSTWMKVKSFDSLLQIITFDRIYIIDTNERIIKDGGLYVFGWIDGEEHSSVTTIRRCKRNLAGDITIAGEEGVQTQESLGKIGIIGRVIWSGESELDEDPAFR